MQESALELEPVAEQEMGRVSLQCEISLTVAVTNPQNFTGEALKA